MRTYDKKVLMNKTGRPYLGVVMEIKDLNYFVPLSSKNSKKLPNEAIIKLLQYDKGQVSNRLCVLLFNNMIPVNKDSISPLNIENIKDIKYKNLLISQMIIIRKEENRIKAKAKKVYTNFLKNKRLSGVCCDFLLLEKKSDEYYKSKN